MGSSETDCRNSLLPGAANHNDLAAAGYAQPYEHDESHRRNRPNCHFLQKIQNDRLQRHVRSMVQLCDKGTLRKALCVRGESNGCRLEAGPGAPLMA
jgi:hypothetical protein